MSGNSDTAEPIQNTIWPVGDFKYVQHGWQCPVCKNVWAPTIPQCFHCQGELNKEKALDKNVDFGRNSAGS